MSLDPRLVCIHFIELLLVIETLISGQLAAQGINALLYIRRKTLVSCLCTCAFVGICVLGCIFFLFAHDRHDDFEDFLFGFWWKFIEKIVGLLGIGIIHQKQCAKKS